MADCLNTVSSGIFNFALAPSSSVYSSIKGAAQLGAAGVGVGMMSRPSLPNFSFNVDIGASAKAKLIDPRYTAPPTPVATLRRPSLEGTAYSAIQALIHYTHNTKPLDNIKYLSGLDNISLPSDEPDAPPLTYPQQTPKGDPGGASTPDLSPPEFSLGDRPELATMTPIDFTPSGLRPVDLGDLMPEYEPPDVSELEWQTELKYEADGGLRAKLRELTEGRDEVSHWIGQMVQAKLYVSDIRELERRTKTQLDQIMDQTAGKNFSLPHGPAEALVLGEAGRELEDSYKAAQKIRDEVFDAAITTVTEAVGRSIVVEQYHFKLYMRYLRQNLRVYQLNLELANQAYNALVEVYGLVERGLRTRIDAYNQYVNAVTAENRALASQVNFTEAEVSSYRAKVQMYAAEVGLRQKSAQVQRDDVRYQALVFDEYQAQLRGALADLQIVETNIEAFQEAVRAYSNHTQWYDSALGAYEAHIDAGVSKIAVDEAKFDSYRQLWAAEGERAGAFREYVQASTSAMDASLQDYREAVRTQQGYFSDVIGALNSSVQAAAGYSQAAGEAAQHAGAYNSAGVSYTSALNDVAVAEGAKDMAQDAILAESSVQLAKLATANEAAKVTAAGALSQAASAIFQVGLSATGASSHRVSGRDSGSTRASAQDRKSFSKVCTYVERPMTL